MNIKIFDCDDWIGIYVGGKLAYEGHQPSCKQVLEALGLGHSINYGDIEDFSDDGNFPEDIKDIKK